LINQVVLASEELMPAVEKMAERTLVSPPLPVRISGEQVPKGFNLPIAIQMTLRKVGREADGSQDAVEEFRVFAVMREPGLEEQIGKS
jgi:hypothetical protein